MTRTPRFSRWAAVLATTAVVLAGLGLPAQADTSPVDPTDPRTPVTVAADGLPTVQIDGVVWSQVVVGNTVYVAGKFTTARPAGSAAGVNTVPRSNVLAYDIRTGELLPWAPVLDGQALSIARSPDGSRIYVTGDFNRVDGAYHVRIAAFDTATGAVVAGFRPTLASRGLAVTATNTTVYVGGNFTSAASVTGGTLVPRSYLAAFSAATGALTPFVADADAPVTALAATVDGSKVVVGGRFTTLGGADAYGLGWVDPTSGAPTVFPANQQIRNAGTASAILSLYADASGIYGSGYHFGGGGNLEGPFRADATTGELIWVADCHGDTYSVYPLGDAIYTASHQHYCGNMGGFPQTEPWTLHFATAFSKAATGVNTPDIYGYADHPGEPAPSLLTWYPQLYSGTYTGQGQAGWSVAGNDDYVVYGGEFPGVNGQPQQGLVRFARTALAPNKQGPRVSGAAFNPRLNSFTSGTVRVSFTANWDRDNETLTYRLYRQSQTVPAIYTTTVTARDWELPTLGFTDTGLTPGSSQRYRLTATDPYGNVAQSEWVTVTVAASGALSTYGQTVLDDNPSSYWRLGEVAGTTSSYDWSGLSDLSVGTGVGRSVSGAVIDDANTASSFDGTGNGLAATQTAVPGPQLFTVESWFRTTTTSGGKIIGFGNAKTGESSNYDRHVYMEPSGQVTFGVYPGTSRTVTSAASFNDGQWHHVVASLGTDGMRLYVDGKRVGQRSDTISAQSYNGYWRVGGDSPWSGAAYFAGDIDEVAVYPTVLSWQQVLDHYTASGRTSPVPPVPADAYGAAVRAATPDLYWRFGESSGTTAQDTGVNDLDGTYVTGVTLGTPGAISGTSSTAVTFDGTSGLVSSQSAFVNPTTYSEELWFSTTTTNGGKLIGFGGSATGLSGSYDRHVYMENSGQLTFGVWTGFTNTITSPVAYNDGAWHHMVATQSAAGMRLYVDGVLVGTNGQIQAQDYTGYWRVGSDTTWGPQPYFAGSIDEVAVYSDALSAQTVADHYALGTAGTLPNQAPLAVFGATASGLGVSVDGTGSSDTDGTVTSWAWDFGDGATGTGSTASHAYATAGTRTITLTVTDDLGATASVQHDVTVTAPANQLPTAAFTASASGLGASFDGSGSTDPDGVLAGYAWDFGDGTTGTGATTSHTYATAGTWQVTLTVTDAAGATASVVHPVQVTAPNAPPTAAFTSTTTGSSVAVDGTGSSDTDGTLASYAWTFGDGATGTGATTTHAYAAAGTWPVTLTVTDDDGATASVTHDVTVAAPTQLASDAFGRTTASGWGSADLGGSWTLVGAASSFAVGGGTGSQRLTAGATRAAYLNGVASTDSDVRVTTSVDKAQTGGGTYVSVIGRRVGTSEYTARLKLLATGVFNLAVTSTGTSLRSVNLPVSFAAGNQIQVRLQVTGTSPTTVRAKAWAAGTAEPATWQVTATDSTAALQTAGGIGLSSYLSASATNAPMTVTFDDLTAVPTSATPPPVNQAPVAAFTSSAAGLVASVDGTGSADPDGTVAAWSWSFGDGTVGTGSTATHTYAASGTYPVTLTVTDAAGATGVVSHDVTVTGVAPVELARDAFGRTLTTGWGVADVGGAWTLAGSAANYAVGSGAGVQRITTAGATRSAYLGSVASTASAVTVGVSLDKAQTGGGTYVSVVGRRVGSAEYSVRLKFLATGAVTVQAMAGATALSTTTLAGTYTPGERLEVRLEVTGVSPTTVRAKVWRAGTAEPTTWTVSGTDATAALQSPGSVGLVSYLSGSATNAPMTVSFDDLLVSPLP